MTSLDSMRRIVGVKRTGVRLQEVPGLETGNGKREVEGDLVVRWLVWQGGDMLMGRGGREYNTIQAFIRGLPLLGYTLGVEHRFISLS